MNPLMKDLPISALFLSMFMALSLVLGITSCSDVPIDQLTPEQKVYELGGKQIERAVILYSEYMREVGIQEASGDLTTEEADQIEISGLKAEGVLKASKSAFQVAVEVAGQEDKIKASLGKLQTVIGSVVQLSATLGMTEGQGDRLSKSLLDGDNPDLLVDLAGLGGRIAIAMVALNLRRIPTSEMTKEQVLDAIANLIIESPANLRADGRGPLDISSITLEGVANITVGIQLDNGTETASGTLSAEWRNDNDTTVDIGVDPLFLDAGSDDFR